jgi:hypothetical protein
MGSGEDYFTCASYANGRLPIGPCKGHPGPVMQEAVDGAAIIHDSTEPTEAAPAGYVEDLQSGLFTPLETSCPLEGLCPKAVEEAANEPPGTIATELEGCSHDSESACGPQGNSGTPDLSHHILVGEDEWSAGVHGMEQLRPVALLPPNAKDEVLAPAEASAYGWSGGIGFHDLRGAGHPGHAHFVRPEHGIRLRTGSVRASTPHTSPAAAFEEAPVQVPSLGRSRLGAAVSKPGRGAHFKQRARGVRIQQQSCRPRVEGRSFIGHCHYYLEGMV